MKNFSIQHIILQIKALYILGSASSRNKIITFRGVIRDIE